MSEPRFYVQEPHVDGLAVLDREKSTMIISSFGDRDHNAWVALTAVADALNAATDRTYPYATNEFKRVQWEAPELVWRVIEYLSYLYLDRGRT